MSIRTWLTLPSLGLLAAACGNDGSATTSDETTSTGGEEGSSSTDDPTVAPETTAPADSSTTDPGTETTAPADTSSGSTGEPLQCGNGDLDDGEECDDENVVDGDTCTATCTIPYEIVWQDSHNGSQSNQDGINEIVIDADGNIIVVGSERVTGEGSNLWVQQYLPDGTVGWTVSYNGLFNGDDEGAAIALLSDGDIVVAGTVEGEFDGEDIFAARIDGTTQELEWEIIQDGPGMGGGDVDDADAGADITVDADDNVYVAGTLRMGAQDWDTWVGKFDADGVEVWASPIEDVVEVPLDGFNDRSRAVAVDADGVTWLLATLETDDGSVGTAFAFDVDGTPLTDETQDLGIFLTDMAFDADGNIVVIGSDVPGDTFDDIIVTKYDPTWAQTWSVTFDGTGSNDFSGGVSVGPSGNVYATGTERILADDYDSFLRVLDADGNPLWGARYGNAEALLADDFAYAVEHPDGDVIAGGRESVLGEQRNGLLIKYSAL